MTAGVSNFLSYEKLTSDLKLFSSDDSDIGTNIEVTIDAFLVKYPTRRYSVTFFVNIVQCEV